MLPMFWRSVSSAPARKPATAAVNRIWRNRDMCGDASETVWGGSVAGECRAVASVVSGVVEHIRPGKTHHGDKEKPQHRRQRHGHRHGGLAADGSLVQWLGFVAGFHGCDSSYSDEFHHAGTGPA